MKDHKVKGNITVLGIDLAKNSFQLHGIDDKGYRVLNKKLTRSKLVAFIANLSPYRGGQVRLKVFVKSQFDN